MEIALLVASNRSPVAGLWNTLKLHQAGAIAGVIGLLAGCAGPAQSLVVSEPVSRITVPSAPVLATSATVSGVAPNVSTSPNFETLRCPEGLVGVFQLQNGQLENRELLGGKDGQCAITDPIVSNGVIYKPYGILPHVETDTVHMGAAIAETIIGRKLGEFKMSTLSWTANIVMNSVTDTEYTINQKNFPAVKIDLTDTPASGRIGSLTFTFVLPSREIPYLIYVETSNPRGYVRSGTERLVQLLRTPSKLD